MLISLILKKNKCKNFWKPAKAYLCLGENLKNKLITLRYYNNDSAPNEKNSLEQTILEEAFSENSLIIAYKMIQRNPRNLTSTTNDETLHKISKTWFFETSTKLFNGTFSCPPKRHIFILKPEKKNPTMLSIISPRIKIIEKSILNTMEKFWKGSFKSMEIKKQEFYKLLKTDRKQIYEKKTKNKTKYFKKIWITKPKFSNNSYGSRINKSAHMALRTIKSWPKNIPFFAKFNRVQTYDFVNNQILKETVLKYFPYTKIWQVIETLLKAKVIEFKNNYQKITKINEMYVIKNSSLTSFLFNVYMTPLDHYVELLKKDCFKPTKSLKEIENEYKKLHSKYSVNTGLTKTLKKLENPESVIIQYKKNFEEFYKKHAKSKSINKTARNILYVRYANDWLLAFVGPYEFVLNICKKIKKFLINKLNLTLNKIVISNQNKEVANFLGFDIIFPYLKKKKNIKVSKIRSITKHISKSKAKIQTSKHKLYKAFFLGLKHDIIKSLSENTKQEKHSIFKIIKNRTKLRIQKSQLSKRKQKNMHNQEKHPKRSKFNKLEKIIQSKLFNKIGRNKYNNKWKLEVSKHFKELFNKNFSIALNSLTTNFKRYKKYFILSGLCKKTIETTKKYIEDLEKIENEIKNNWIKERRKNELKNYEKKQYKTTQKNFTQTIDLISLQILNQKNFKHIQIKLNIKKLFEKLRIQGFIHTHKNRAIANSKLLYLADHEIIIYYNTLIRGYLNWFKPADNNYTVKSIYYLLIRSCLITLSRKHRKDFSWAIHTFSKEPQVNFVGKNFAVPGRSFITAFNQKFLQNVTPFDEDEL